MLTSHFLPSEDKRQRINLKSQENSSRSILLRYGGSDPPKPPRTKEQKEGLLQAGWGGQGARAAVGFQASQHCECLDCVPVFDSFSVCFFPLLTLRGLGWVRCQVVSPYGMRRGGRDRLEGTLLSCSLERVWKLNSP